MCTGLQIGSLERSLSMLTLERQTYATLEQEEQAREQGLREQRQAYVVSALAGETITLDELDGVGWTPRDLTAAVDRAKTRATLLETCNAGQVDDELAGTDPEITKVKEWENSERLRIAIEARDKITAIQSRHQDLLRRKNAAEDARVKLTESMPVEYRQKVAQLLNQLSALSRRVRTIHTSMATSRDFGALSASKRDSGLAEIRDLEHEMAQIVREIQVIEGQSIAAPVVAVVE